MTHNCSVPPQIELLLSLFLTLLQWLGHCTIFYIPSDWPHFCLFLRRQRESDNSCSHTGTGTGPPTGGVLHWHQGRQQHQQQQSSFLEEDYRALVSLSVVCIIDKCVNHILMKIHGCSYIEVKMCRYLSVIKNRLITFSGISFWIHWEYCHFCTVWFLHFKRCRGVKCSTVM